jgi:hypothetical protein
MPFERKGLGCLLDDMCNPQMAPHTKLSLKEGTLGKSMESHFFSKSDNLKSRPLAKLLAMRPRIIHTMS